jgi:GNAT superfamily N-acetyltransferase
VDVHEIEAGASATGARAMRELRPDSPALASPERFAAHVDEVLRAQGYRLVGSFVEGSADAVAVIGFRHADSLGSGRYCYVEDVVALPEARKDGHAQALMEWVVEDARRLGCKKVELNSGVQRQAAHRFYLNQRFVISAFHFLREPWSRAKACLTQAAGTADSSFMNVSFLILLVAVVSLTTSPARAALAEPTAAPKAATHVAAASQAPADEYFGRLHMSAIGIRMRIDVLGRRYHARTESDDDLIHDAGDVSGALRIWNQRYPDDTWAAPTAYHLAQLYAELQTTEARSLARIAFAYVASTYPTSKFAHFSRVRLAQGFAPLHDESPVVASPSPNGSALPQPAVNPSPAPSAASPAPASPPSGPSPKSS